MTREGTLTHDPPKGYKKYSIPVGCAATVEADLFPPDPDPVESVPPEPDHIEGLSLRMTQAMNHYQRQEHRCFMCGDTGHYARDCPHHETFHKWHKEHLNSLEWQEEQDTCPKEKPIELATQITSYPEVNQTLKTGPMTRWVEPETLVDVLLEGCEVLSLADSGSQVNTMMLEFIQERGYPVLPLDGLVNYPLHLVGLGG